ncbi:hypothetical protein LOTGIDRAFT_238014 [Lottia gigantea]|uniref:Uncharacterized protein n=1 Tax=Lottia gigantea TaxID=225164 RepID=V4CJ90_LOTGI|nr:hypothetical protein LOTGIDRAFT_238014 [Lottia gigantea]ESP02275.1 hypothetical protein LOTGIDRAFT_238014 [Lottia gigantea]
MINRIKRIFGFDKDQPENTKLDFPKLKEIEDDVFIKDLREKTLKYVPLLEEDCLSCKLISTGITLGTSIYIMITACKLTPKQPTVTKKVSVIVCGSSVSLVLAFLAYTRFFDAEFFTSEKPFLEMLEDEKAKLKELAKKK